MISRVRLCRGIIRLKKAICVAICVCVDMFVFLDDFQEVTDINTRVHSAYDEGLEGFGRGVFWFCADFVVRKALYEASEPKVLGAIEE